MEYGKRLNPEHSLRTPRDQTKGDCHSQPQ